MVAGFTWETFPKEGDRAEAGDGGSKTGIAARDRLSARRRSALPGTDGHRGAAKAQAALSGSRR